MLDRSGAGSRSLDGLVAMTRSTSGLKELGHVRMRTWLAAIRNSTARRRSTKSDSSSSVAGPIGVDPRVGSEFLGYRIERLVGRGGMGVVYRAYDLRLKRNVALKLVAPEYAGDARFRERFLAETELAASLEHPAVVPIYDAGEVDGQLYLAMRFVEGTDLKRVVTEEAPLEPARALTIVSHVAEALDAAHERGLVHRDVKPSNVLLDEREHPYLADFGLTRRLDDPGSPAAGLSAGTPAYVAPEQIRGDPIDGRADQYALACLLHECLTGEPPFRRPTEVALLYAHLEDDPLPTGRPVDAVFAKALAKDPAERYASCAELIAAAREALGIAKPKPKRRWPFAAAALLLALVAAALAVVLVTRGSTGEPETNGRLIRIDPSTNRAAATIAVGNEPSAVAVVPNGVWIAHKDAGSLWRVDPETNEVNLKVSARGAPADLAANRSHVVVAHGPVEAKLALVDPATGIERELFSIARGRFFGSASVAAADAGVWVATGDRRIGRLNVLTGELIDPVVVPQPPTERADSIFSGITVGEGAAWVIGDPLEHVLWRIDPSTGALLDTIQLAFAPTDVAAGEGAVWVTSQLGDTVSRIDPASREIETIAVGHGAGGIAVGLGSVWVANAIDGTVARIDPQTLEVETIDVDAQPEDVGVGVDAVWVAARAAAGAIAEDTIAVGVLAPCDGNFGSLVPVSFAGVQLPLLRRGASRAGPRPVDGVSGARVAGKDVELVFACGDDSAQAAVTETRRLVESRGADIVIGSYYEGEATAIREYARTRPDVTFLNGIASAQSLTLREPAPNYFRFLPDGAQWQAGVGRYAYDRLGWRTIVTVVDASAFNYTHTAGFVAEFCAVGGHVAKQISVPNGTSDLAPFLALVPRSGVDGFLINADPPTTLAFLEGVPQLAGPLGDRLIGSIQLTVPPIPETLGSRLDGIVLGAPDDTETRRSKAFVSAFGDAFPDLAGQGFFFGAFYGDSMEAAIQALEAVDGDLSDGQRRFQAALAKVELDTPTAGRIRLDERRQAIGTTYLVKASYRNNAFSWKTLSVAENVEQTFGGYFSAASRPPSTNTIPCKRGNPPPWARR